MIDRLAKEKCTGCFACVQKCPQRCIKVIKDEEGFLAPMIETEKCIQCELCERSCPQLTSIELKPNLMAYAVRIKDDELLKRSTSGGVFALAAKKILQSQGIVFGATMDEQGIVKHIAIKNAEELSLLQGSKYVQSNIMQTYIEAKQFLEQGKKVLFSGTPCQIAGFYGFLGKRYKELYTMDIVCHGIPSQELFSTYRKWLEKKKKQNILEWRFRDKSAEGWNLLDVLVYDKKTIPQREQLNHYTRAFLDGKTYRESCYRCLYGREERVGDLTVGDYWGIKKYHPEFYSPKGVSLLLVNTKQGEKLLERLKDEMYFEQSHVEWMQTENHNLCQPTKRPVERTDFYKDFYTKNINRFVKENMAIPLSFKELLKKWIPYKIRVQLKKILKK